MMNAATAENTGDTRDIVDYEWETLSAAEIYDAFHRKGLKLGIQANKND